MRFTNSLTLKHVKPLNKENGVLSKTWTASEFPDEDISVDENNNLLLRKSAVISCEQERIYLSTKLTIVFLRPHPTTLKGLLDYKRTKL